MENQEGADSANSTATDKPPPRPARKVGVIQRYLEKRRAEKQAQTPTDRAAKSTARATWVIAFFTVAMVGVGTLQWNTLHHTDNSIAAQLQEMKQQRLFTIAQLRANLKRDIVLHPRNEEGRLIAAGLPATWDVNPTWQNTGGSDARNFRSWWALKSLPMPPAQDGRVTVDCPHPDTTEKVNPTIITPGATRTLIAKSLGLPDARAAAARQTLIFISVRAEYQDIFYPESPAHFSEWCVMALPNDLEAGEISFPTVREEGN